MHLSWREGNRQIKKKRKKEKKNLERKEGKQKYLFVVTSGNKTVSRRS